MAKTIQSLDANDLTVKPIKNASATFQRGDASQPEETVPLHFRVSAELAQAFKQEALNRRMKLVDLFKYAFDELRKS